MPRSRLVLSHGLDLMISEVFSNLTDLVIQVSISGVVS